MSLEAGLARFLTHPARTLPPKRPHAPFHPNMPACSRLTGSLTVMCSAGG